MDCTISSHFNIFSYSCVYTSTEHFNVPFVLTFAILSVSTVDKLLSQAQKQAVCVINTDTN